MKTCYLVILSFILCPVNSNSERNTAINYVMIEEALQRRIDAIKDKIDMEGRERERQIQENNAKFDELQRRAAVGETIEVDDAGQETELKRNREDNDVAKESKNVEETAAGHQPNFLFHSEALARRQNRRIVRRRDAARKFRMQGSTSKYVRRRRRRRSRSPKRRRRRRRRRNKNLTSAYAENFGKVNYNSGSLSRFKRV